MLQQTSCRYAITILICTAIMAASTIAIVIVTSIYTHYAGQQVEKTGKAIFQGSQALHVTILSSKNTLNEMKSQTGAMQKAADANKKAAGLAESNIKTIQEQFRLEQHPWLFINTMGFDKDLSTTEFPQVDYIIHNAGKTPAVNIRQKFELRVVVPQMPDVIAPGEIPNILTLAPNKELPNRAKLNMYLPQKTIDAIESGVAKFYFRIDITFNDVFKGSDTHGIKTCGFYLAKSKRVFDFCEGEEGNQYYDIKNTKK